MTFFRRPTRSSLPISTLVVAIPALFLLLTLQACMGAIANNGDPSCPDGTDCAALNPTACEGYGYGYGYGGKECRD
jgi:hypothetical protein